MQLCLIDKIIGVAAQVTMLAAIRMEVRDVIDNQGGMNGVDQSRRYDLSMRAINPVERIDVLEDAVFTLR